MITLVNTYFGALEDRPILGYILFVDLKNAFSFDPSALVFEIYARLTSND